MIIRDDRQGIDLIKEPALDNITQYQVIDGAGKVTAHTKEGYSIALDYDEIENFVNEMMRCYTGNLMWRSR